MVGLTIAPTWVLMRAGVEGIDPYASAAAAPVLEPLALPVALPQVKLESPQQFELDPYQPDPVIPVVPPAPTPPEPVRERILERGTASGPNAQRPTKKKKHKKKRVKAKKHTHKAKKRKVAPKTDRTPGASRERSPLVDQLVKKVLKQQTALLAARGKPLPGGIVLPPKCPLH